MTTIQRGIRVTKKIVKYFVLIAVVCGFIGGLLATGLVESLIH